MKRDELKIKKRLLEKMPYEKQQLEKLSIGELKMLASVLGINSKCLGTCFTFNK